MDGEPVGLLIANIHDRGVLGALGIFSKWIVTSEEEYLGSLSPPSGLPPTSSLSRRWLHYENDKSLPSPLYYPSIPLPPPPPPHH